MMKWGKKGSHSLPTYLINHVFPISWLNKLKRKVGSSQAGTKQAKRTEKVPEISRCLSMPAKWKEGRFYTGSDDPYWRLSFGEDSLQEKKGSDVRAVLYNSDDEFNVPKSSWRSSRSRSSEGNRLPLKETVAEVNDITEKVRNTQERYELKGLKAREQRLKAPAENVRKVQEQRSVDRRVLKEKKSEIDKKQERVARSTQKDVYEAKPMKPVKIRDELQKSGIDRGKRNIICPSCSARMSKENCTFDDSGIEDVNEYPEAEFTSEIQNSERKKINEMLSKNEHHRLSVHLSRRVQIKGRKPNRKINSPTGRNSAKSKCKTKEAEFVEKQKRMKRITKDMDIEAEAKTAFDSYAVPKSSYDPQQDFRDSMLEMIIEEGIKQPEDLEELLVCYLTQNYDEYHDLIIKVFRQVWFDLNHVCLSSSW